MSGHSKWSQIKRQKGAADAKRGQVFTKLGREIQVATREGGPDPNANPRLRLAVQRAREARMPAENIERAIQRASGAGADAANLEEITYEGYGPGGAAILVEAMTDNRNRTAAEVRNVFKNAGGGLGESGCVAWNFDNRGVITVDDLDDDPEEVALKAIDAGADDFRVDDRMVEIYTTPAELERVRARLEQQDVRVSNAEAALLPKTTLELEPKNAAAVLKLMEKLEDLDDVQRVWSNIEITDAALAEFQR